MQHRAEERPALIDALKLDLRECFLCYANGSELMSASMFQKFAWDAMLMQDSSDVEGFFKMALQSRYKATLKINYDRFLAALARVIENLAATQGYPLEKCAELLCHYHIGPTVTSGREHYYYMGPQGSEAPDRRGPPRPDMGHPRQGAARTGRHAPPTLRAFTNWDGF